MDAELAKQLADINKRLDYQELIHKEVEDNPNVAHGLVNNTVVIVLASIVVTSSVVLIINHFVLTKSAK